MKTSFTTFLLVKFPVKGISITFDLSWLIVFPVGLWAVEQYYVAILGAFLDPTRAWAVTVFIGLLVLLSLGAHFFAHILTAWAFKIEPPRKIPLLLFGDAAQAWPVSSSAGKELSLALAGLLVNLIVAGLAYLAWNTQLNPYLNISLPFIAVFNTWLAITNLTPVYPLDGGRITAAILAGSFQNPARRAKLCKWLSLGLILALTGWSIFLLTQQAHYSIQTSGITLLYTFLLAAGLWMHPPASDVERVEAGWHRLRPLRVFPAALLVLSLLSASVTVLLTNNGLEAPGVALSVEPMVEIPANLRHAHAGSFILTSVIVQSPVPAGAWLMRKFIPQIQIFPPDPYLPDQPSPQETARQGFQMLDTSETTALVVGLRLVGYPASLQGKGVQVDSILPESHAQRILRVGDVITGLDGKSIQLQSDLTNQFQTKKTNDIVRLTIQRRQSQLDALVKLLAPALPGNLPRIGITIETAGFDAHLPIPAKIVPQKIVGGPSAGLMFTLTVDNLLQSQDLTGGRRIAGTGMINPDGTVGPIGGVEQKVIAAEAAGAEYFLSPTENYAAARAAARHIRVIQVATVEQAITFLHNLPGR